MSWWMWALVFLLILAGGGWWIWTRIRVTLASFRGLSAQLRATQALIARLEDAAGANISAPEPPRLAVFTRPDDAYRERIAIRETLRQERRAKLEKRLPPWARS
ncbi:MAG: hypothetical protein IPH03_13560 [Tetrasphaera sp.]|jgi:hypothetical protein|nr:hypothetical protein [Tetrasphaera sp.]